ncbi:MAG: outer membrane beta-barrel protein [Candidatus Eisenbacteria bacterium]|uniref:Outer membrane beta-barrel protein n=1 Tax=Eiseniibacteriota bacterium TaxID=2212470 RepID=A0A7Y2H416_UNCEI|nr:outer membrane beta-barrel protein [Candidatus Eisenbacteria bacterium]
MFKKVLAGSLLAALTVAPAVSADGFGYRGWGPRGGVTAEPDQVHFGAHLDFGHIADRVRFQPNAEFGIGDDASTFAINGEATYRFVQRWDAWSPYAGAGVGLNIVSLDEENGGDTSSDLGVNAIVGLERGLSNGSRLFLEGKFGLVDSPDFKFTVGGMIY